MRDLLEMNVAGRLMLLLTRIGEIDARGLAVFEGAVTAAVRYRMALEEKTELGAIAPLIVEELALLEQALRRRRGTASAAGPGF